MATGRSTAPERRGRRRRGVLAGLAAAALAVLPLQTLQAGPAQAATLVSDPASLVNPLIGTSGAVDTFPGADAPFGMVQWSPDTTPDRPAGGGYEYNDKKTTGYSLTHISGPGCSASGDLPILPWTGSLGADLGSASVGFSHGDEQAQPGDYRLTDAAGVRSELTATTRAGVGRFSFPAGSPAQLLLKLSGGATQVDGTRAQIVGDHEVTGAIDSGHFCGAKNTYTLHFDIQFNKAFQQSGTWTGSKLNSAARSLRLGRPAQNLTTGDPKPEHTAHATAPTRSAPTLHGQKSAEAKPPVTGANGVYLAFDPGSTVTARVGVSYTSDANAALNLSHEVHGWNIGTVRDATHKSWNDVLGKVRVGGGSAEQQTSFYTALYHSLLHPNVFSDVNGQYEGMDDQLHTLAKGQQAQYANYSGWDIYRSQVQLVSVLQPKAASDIVTSMLNGYDQTGIMPKWSQNNGESYVMVGDPADPVISDAYAFGARDFDTSKALKAMVHEATATSNDRPGQSVRDAKGYLPGDGTQWNCCNFYGPVSTQEEYDTADYAIAALAKDLGKTATYKKFATRAQDWQNVFNPETGYLQAKLSDGEFAPDFTPGTSNGFVEGTSAQYTPMIPFNIEGLIQSRGGDDAWNGYLDSLLSNVAKPTSTGADLSNEPSLEIPWEYDYSGQPWKAQKAVREAQQSLWFDAPVGSFGNDDLGAMSSWYVWSALGMYPETPGTDTLALGSPVFPKAEVALGSGHTLHVNASGAADDSPYVQGLKVKGASWDKPWLTWTGLTGGGTLDYTLGSAPNTSWGSGSDAAPPSDTTGQRSVLASAGSGLILAPGDSAQTTLSFANISDKAVSVSFKATPPDGVTLDTPSGTVKVPAHGKATQKLAVKAGATEGAYTVPVTLTAGGKELPDTALRVSVAKPGELWPYQSNTGTYADGAAFTAGFDDGGWAYSTDQLAASGVKSGSTVTSDGITYTWPGGTGKPDNIEAAGQTVPLQVPAGTDRIGFLGAATNAPSQGLSGKVTVTYTDGTTSTGTLTFSDWTLNADSSKPAASDTVVAKTPYRNSGNGTKQTISTYLFSTSVAVQSGKRVASLTLPGDTDGTLHVFSLGYGS